jgi:hypothetical protein
MRKLSQAAEAEGFVMGGAWRVVRAAADSGREGDGTPDAVLEVRAEGQPAERQHEPE